MASSYWPKLNGLICIYKPSNKCIKSCKKSIINNLINDLDAAAKLSPREKYIRIDGSGHPSGENLKVNIIEKLSTHPLALGSLHNKWNFKLTPANFLSNISSGVCVMGLNRGASFAHLLKNSSIIKTFRVTGLLGKATRTSLHGSNVIEKSTYKYVTQTKLERILMKIQSNHQAKSVESLGLNLASQEAYELLSQSGIIRPNSPDVTLLYTLKCVDFDPPNFTIELSCVNESEAYLGHLIHNLGLELKTNACVTKIRCIRFGPFTVDDALVVKHWTLDLLVENVRHMFEKQQTCSGDLVPESPTLTPLDNEQQIECT